MDEIFSKQDKKKEPPKGSSFSGINELGYLCDF